MKHEKRKRLSFGDKVTYEKERAIFVNWKKSYYTVKIKGLCRIFFLSPEINSMGIRLITVHKNQIKRGWVDGNEM